MVPAPLEEKLVSTSGWLPGTLAPAPTGCFILGLAAFLWPSWPQSKQSGQRPPRCILDRNKEPAGVGWGWESENGILERESPAGPLPRLPLRALREGRVGAHSLHSLS